MIFSLGKMKSFFTDHPLPYSAVQISSRYISGIHLTHKERKLRDSFILPLPKGIVRPSFEKANIKDPSSLEKRITEGVKNLNIYDHGASLLLPELSQRTFVFAFDSLPASSREREQIIRFRVKKQIPLLAADARIAFDVIQSKGKKKVISSIARASVVSDLEEFFNRIRLKTKSVSIPILGLSNLINRNKEKDFLLVNIEEDAFDLLAVADSEILLYRQKPLMGGEGREGLVNRVQNILQEIENTANFIEDKEKRKIASVWIRLGWIESEEDMLAAIGSRLNFPMRTIEPLVKLDLPDREKRVLSPLIGQIL
jgi:hypothetical protein